MSAVGTSILTRPTFKEGNYVYITYAQETSPGKLPAGAGYDGGGVEPVGCKTLRTAMWTSLASQVELADVDGTCGGGAMAL